MDDLIEISTGFDEQGLWRVHYMTPSIPDPAAVSLQLGLPAGARLAIDEDEVGFWHVKGAWAYRGPCVFQAKGCPKWQREVVVHYIEAGQRMREAVEEAAKEFYRWQGRLAGYAFARQVPAGTEDLTAIETELGDDEVIVLVQAGWVPRRCVAVGW